jgi:DNA-binding LacI/PurR family transcriptional regulator
MKRSDMKLLVPRGYGKLIAQKAGVTEMTVSQFLNGKNDNIKVELATLEILAELADKKEFLVNKIKGTNNHRTVACV